jgi:hypothetical protein
MDEKKNEGQAAPRDVSIQRVENGFALYIGGTAWNSRGGVGEMQVAETVPALLRLVDGWAQRHDPRQGDLLAPAKMAEAQLAHFGKVMIPERTVDNCPVGLVMRNLSEEDVEQQERGRVTTAALAAASATAAALGFGRISFVPNDPDATAAEEPKPAKTAETPRVLHVDTGGRRAEEFSGCTAERIQVETGEALCVIDGARQDRAYYPPGQWRSFRYAA